MSEVPLYGSTLRTADIMLMLEGDEGWPHAKSDCREVCSCRQGGWEVKGWTEQFQRQPRSGAPKHPSVPPTDTPRL